MYLCQQCGKEVFAKYASGKFCCRSCSNKWVALHQSDDAKARKVLAGKDNLIHSSEFTKAQWINGIHNSHSQKMMGHYVSDEYRKKISDAHRGKRLSEETKMKISDALIASINEGRRSGYQHSKHPYSEIYVESILKENGIRYEPQKRYRYIDSIGRKRVFYLDFYLPKWNIDLEVDGSFHKREPQLSMDKIRDSVVSESMVVYRLNWFSVGTTELNNEIMKFLNYVNTLDD